MHVCTSQDCITTPCCQICSSSSINVGLFLNVYFCTNKSYCFRFEIPPHYTKELQNESITYLTVYIWGVHAAGYVEA